MADTEALEWRTPDSVNDALADANAAVLAGVLRSNTTLTSLTLAAESKMSDVAQSIVGRSMLNNTASRVGFINGAPPRATHPSAIAHARVPC